MKLPVRLYARARDLAGADTVQIELEEGATIAMLRSALMEQYPQLQPVGSSLLFAVGTDYAAETHSLNAESQVTCFPPVSGG